MRITLYNNDGTVAKRNIYLSNRQLKRAHQRGKCDAFCSYCSEDGCKLLADRKEGREPAHADHDGCRKTLTKREFEDLKASLVIVPSESEAL
jgi:hypothetical protein